MDADAAAQQARAGTVTLFLRDVGVRIPRVYTRYQMGGLERLRRRVSPLYEKQFKGLRNVPWSWGGPMRSAVDVGANMGQSSWALSRLFPQVRIDAFEANPVVAAACQDLLADLDRVTVHAVGLGASPGAATIFVPAYRGVLFPGLASLSEERAHDWFSPDLVRGYRESDFSVQRHDVTIRTLDSFDRDPQLVKVDVEGLELDVLAGATETLDRAGPTLLVECNGTFDEVNAFLTPLGYEAWEFVGPDWRPSRGEELNQAFVRSSRVDR